MTFWNGVKLFGLVIVLAIAGIMYTKYEANVRELDKARNAQIVALTEKLNGVVGERASQAKIIANLTEQQKASVAELTKAHGKVSSSVKTVVEFKDRVQFLEKDQSWSDSHGRFSLHLPDGVFTRQQRFEYSAVVVKSRDGKVRVMKEEFAELEPSTGKRITDEAAPKLTTTFRFTEDNANLPGYFHPRGVVGIDFAGRPLAGVELLNLERTGRPVLRDINLGIIGGYDRKSRHVLAAGYAGYRIFSSNVSGIAYYGASSAGGPIAGVGIVVEVSR